MRVYASKSSPKKLRKAKEAKKIVNPQLAEGPPDEHNQAADESASTDVINNLESQASIAIASRSSVLQACTVTSGFIALLGVIIRQGSHLASSQGWPIVDCSSEISCKVSNKHCLDSTFIVLNEVRRSEDMSVGPIYLRK